MDEAHKHNKKQKNLYTIDIKSKNQAKTHTFHDMTG